MLQLGTSVWGMLAGVALGATAANADAPVPWQFSGGDLSNSRANLSRPEAQFSPTQINPTTASRLKIKWMAKTSGDVAATPTVEAGGLYVPDWNGSIYKLDPETGRSIWVHKIAIYTGDTQSRSRTSPAIGALNELVIGASAARDGVTPGARVISLSRATGELIWHTVVDSNPHATIVTAPVIYNHLVYVGVASTEEALASSVPGFQATFQGSVVALDEASGKVVWKFTTVPRFYTGGAVWGGSFAVWPAGKSLFVTTGNNYSIPRDAARCVVRAGADIPQQLGCLDATDFVDSILALDLQSGRLKWARRVQGADTWNIACTKGPENACPNPSGKDNDFGSAANLAWVPGVAGKQDDRGSTGRTYVLGAGQKSGVYWALNPANGGLFWRTSVGDGGIVWGSAINTDDKNSVFVSLNNSAHRTNMLPGAGKGDTLWNAGAWGAIDIVTGKLKWQIPAYGSDLGNPVFGGAAPGALSFTNRVVLAGSTSGIMAALDAQSGHLLWHYPSGAQIVAGPAVYNEVIYWGSGYNRNRGAGMGTLFAFSVQ